MTNTSKARRAQTTVLVTVGTTKFDALTRAADSLSLAQLLASQGYTKLILQVGSSETFLPSALVQTADEFVEVEVFPNFTVSWFRYAPTLKDIMGEAGLVISHAGAGSIFESLQAGKRLIAVPNGDLMDNHQADLCDHLQKQGYLEVADVKSLEDACVRVEARGGMTPYVPDDGTGIADAITHHFLLNGAHKGN
jgi:beta-1,4-N-acetylglucosaminyltransferase